MKNNKKNDMFANIASMSQDFAHRGLEKPPVMQTPDIKLTMGDFDNLKAYCPKKMDTKEELYAEVEKQKKIYAPFMQKLAPKAENLRIKTQLTDFLFKHEDDEDWQKIKVPHYDGPVGRHTTYYKTTFTATQQMLDKESLHICFDGADYIANVMINGNFVGRHEGFFAAFDFEFKKFAKLGDNELLIRLENDVAMVAGGDKIYAATGMGFDEPEVGWHHCPAGMGIFQRVYIEARTDIYMQNLYVRTLPNKNDFELWAEVVNTEAVQKDVKFSFSVFGQNFDATIIKDEVYSPTTSREIGVGDSLNEALTRKDNLLGVPVVLKLFGGINYFKIPFSMQNAKLWELDTPYLYEAQLSVYSNDIKKDVQCTEFGVRTFTMDTENTPKGKMYFNDRQIRLRGANTMGHEQQDVYKDDYDQLITDILLAKICNMNFFRLTQRPVQDEIYQYCDMLGIMTQTDLPLFGKLRINQFCECLRQAGEMERLVRPHACNIMVSYINEPFPNADNAPHRNLSRTDLMSFFECADKVVLLNNPDRVIKHVDGDYDPPSVTMPDNHCYTMWYNGNGIDIGALNKGEWMPIKKDWHFGCGEFGSEGIDTPEVMRKYYPAHWINTKGREAEWTPTEVTGAQTGKFHHFFFETPKSMEEWAQKSRAYQAAAVKWQTECYRRNPLMVSFAIHLFIDAFPSNWMKTIMDVERTPKPAYFTYRNALKPISVSIRSDYHKVFGGSTINVQPFVCNDLDKTLNNYTLLYGIDELNIGATASPVIGACTANNMGNLEFAVPTVAERTAYTIRVVLLDEDKNTVDWATHVIEAFPVTESAKTGVCAYGDDAISLVEDMEYTQDENSNIIIVSDYSEYLSRKEDIDKRVNAGAKLIHLRLGTDVYEICAQKLDIKFSAMLPLHFVSRDTGHIYTDGIKADDIKYWYDELQERIAPILMDSFCDDTFTPILYTGNANEAKEWSRALAAAEKKIGDGKLIICQVDLVNRVKSNPIAKIFAQNMINL